MNLSSVLAKQAHIDTSATQIHISTKETPYGIDYTFRDAYGREIFFKGWNVSASVKLKETHFKPFKNDTDARKSFKKLAENGFNVIRYTIAWEGVNPDVDYIDTLYLKNITRQINIATDFGLFILIDYHQDLFSRHLFDPNDKWTGNGAPKWIIKGDTYPPSTCKGIIGKSLCNQSWGVLNEYSPAVLKAYRNFWNNTPLQTSKGTRYIQDAFLYQLKHTLLYIKTHLPPDKFNYILGIDPMNEPSSGHIAKEPAFTNDYLWPFYQKVKEVLDQNGWEKKWVFAEYDVLWNTQIKLVQTKGRHLDLNSYSTQGFVFNAHFYDAPRISQVALIGGQKKIYPYEFIDVYDNIRKEARWLGIPAFVSEFGFANKVISTSKSWNSQQEIYAHYIAMGVGKRHVKNYTYRPRLYANLLPSTQWNWDIYAGKHHVEVNDNPNRIEKKGDAWNGEFFSNIYEQDNTIQYTHHKYLIEQVNPRYCQGSQIAFVSNLLPVDEQKNTLKWISIHPTKGPLANQSILSEKKWSLFVWRSNDAQAPTEIYIPAHYNVKSSSIISNADNYQIENQLLKIKTPRTSINELYFVLIIDEQTDIENISDLRLSIYETLKANQAPYIFHIK